MSKLEGIVLFVQFLGLPFAIGAAFHFFGAWVGVPALLVGGIWWLGVCAMMGELG